MATAACPRLGGRRGSAGTWRQILAEPLAAEILARVPAAARILWPLRSMLGLGPFDAPAAAGSAPPTPAGVDPPPACRAARETAEAQPNRADLPAPGHHPPPATLPWPMRRAEPALAADHIRSWAYPRPKNHREAGGPSCVDNVAI